MEVWQRFAPVRVNAEVPGGSKSAGKAVAKNVTAAVTRSAGNAKSAGKTVAKNGTAGSAGTAKSAGGAVADNGAVSRSASAIFVTLMGLCFVVQQ